MSVEVVVDGGANDLLSCFYDFDEFVLRIYGFEGKIGGEGGGGTFFSIGFCEVSLASCPLTYGGCYLTYCL